MRRLICAVVLGCFAVASAIPLPESEPTRREDVMNMILSAKPEDNDIDFNPTEVSLPEEDSVNDEILEPQAVELQEQSDASSTHELPAAEPPQEAPETVIQDLEDHGGDDSVEPEQTIPAEYPDELMQEKIPIEQVENLENEPVIIFPTNDEDTPVIIMTDDHPMPVESLEDPVITEQEYDELSVLPIDELPVQLDDVEQMFPGNEEEETIDIEEDTLPFIPEQENSEQFSEPEVTEELGEPEYINPSPQSDLIMPSFEPQDTVFGPYPGQQVIPSINENPESPVYFDVINVPDITYLDDDYHPGMPGDQLPPFVSSHVPGDHIINSDAYMPDDNLPFAPIPEENHFYEDPTFRLSPPMHPFADNEPDHEILEVYYIPEESVPVPHSRYEYPYVEAPFVSQEESISEKEPVFEGFSVEPIPQANEFAASDSSVLGEAISDGEPTVMESNHADLSDDFVTNVDAIDFVSIEPFMGSETSVLEGVPSELEDELVELEKIDPPVILEQFLPDGNEEPALEIIQLDSSSFQDPVALEPVLTGIFETQPNETPALEELLENDTQQVTANEQIADLTDDGSTLTDSLWIPEPEEQHPILFPDDVPQVERLPVFPSQWRNDEIIPNPEDSVFLQAPVHDDDITIESYPVSEYPNVPSFSQIPSAEQQNSVEFSLQNGEAPSEDFDFMFSSSIPQIQDEIVSFYDDDREHMESGHNHLSEVFMNQLGYPNLRKRIQRPSFYGLPSVFGMTFQQDYRGPITYPLNFRRSDFSNQIPGWYSQETAPMTSNQGNRFFSKIHGHQDFPNAFTDSVNMFSRGSDPFQTVWNAGYQDMNIKGPHNAPTFMTSDSQVSYVPYENTYSIPPYSQSSRTDFMYPYSQQPSKPTYSTYEGFSFNMPAYGGSFYSSPFSGYRYNMPYRFGGQNGYYNRYNYPVPTW